MRKEGFIMLNRSDTMKEIMKDPFCFVLLCQIGYRARRKDGFSILGLKPGEALLGDISSIGLTSRQYRTAKDKLSKRGFATFKTTNKGTIAKLVDNSLIDANISSCDKQNDNQETIKRQSNDNQETTNNKDNKDNKDNNNKIRESKKDVEKRRIKKKFVELQEDKEFMGFAEKVFVGWNNQTMFKECRALTPKVLVALKDIIDINGKDSIKIAFVNYKVNIANRKDPEHQHYPHRYSLYEFLTKDGIFDRFYNQ